MVIKMNPGLAPGKLRAEFATKKRLQMRDFLTEESARTIYADLQNLDWWLAYRDGGAVIELSPEQLRTLSAEQAAAIRQTVDEGARQGYQFLYNYFPLFKQYFVTGGGDRAVFRLYEFLNSPQMIGFFRELTGLDDIAWADGQATLYRATHFLKFHTDDVPAEKRRAAYVLNLTPDWDLDWGGLLQFWSDENDVEHAYRPIFNALNIFTVPSRHSVSAVASYAPGLRFSITGWLRAGEPPGKIGCSAV
jgi:SM-20-related protein